MLDPYDLKNDPQFMRFFGFMLDNKPEQSERNKALDDAIHAVSERKVLQGSIGLISKEITIQAIERLKE